MRRDLEFSQTFNERLKEENNKLKGDVEDLKRYLDLKDKEKGLLVKQVQGLQEDNDRIARMYQMVQDVATKKLTEEEVVIPSSAAYKEKMLKDKEEQNAQKGWKRIHDDGFGGNLSEKRTIARTDLITHLPNERMTPQKPSGSMFDQRATVKKE